jgi:predicted nucleic acid-binding protein
MDTVGVAMKPRVYVETSLPSFYFEKRTEPEMVARRLWTREWWVMATRRYDLATSVAVLNELKRGDFAAREDCLKLLDGVQLLATDPPVVEIAEAYVAHHVMPKDPLGDALHLALASYYKCDFLVAWNCAHLANANKFGHIRRINTILGIHIPALVTPLEMIGEEE